MVLVLIEKWNKGLVAGVSHLDHVQSSVPVLRIRGLNLDGQGKSSHVCNHMTLCNRSQGLPVSDEKRLLLAIYSMMPILNLWTAA